MKRLLVIFMILTLIASWFINVAYADPPSKDKVYISLDKDYFYHGTGFSKAEISGRVLLVSNNSRCTTDIKIYIYKDNGDGVLNEDDVQIAKGTAVNGRISKLIVTNAPETGIGQYWVVGEDTDEYEFDSSEEAPYGSFTIMYDIEFIEPDELEWKFPINDPVIVQGVFVNENSSKEDDVYIAYTDTFDYLNRETSSIAKASFNNHSLFGFLFDGAQFYKTGEVGIYINGILAVRGYVKSQDLEVEVTPTELVRYVGETTFTVKFELDDHYLNSDNNSMADGYEIRATVEDPDDEETGTYTLINSDSKKFTRFYDQELDINIDAGDIDTGNWYVTFELFYCGDSTTPESDKHVISEKILKIRVINPTRYNLVGWELEEHSVGDIEFALPGAFSSNYQNIEVLKYSKYADPVVEECEYIELIVEGCGIKQSIKSFGNDDDDSYDGILKISPNETGELKVTINIYSSEDDKTIDYTFTKKIDIIGWNIKVIPNEVLVGYDGKVKFIITDEDGKPVNNAIIEIDNKKIIDARSTNIVRGIYIYDDDPEEVFKEVGSLPITFWRVEEYTSNGDPEIIKESGMQVIGDEVYSVTSETDTLLNGIKETILVTVLDDEGDMIYPSYWRINVDADGNKSTPIEITSSDLGVFVDVDGKKGKEARKITLTPTANQASVIIRATTENGEKMGEVEIPVIPPKALMKGVKTLTENFTSEIKVILVDPRDYSEIDADFYLVDNSDYLDWDQEEDWEYDYDEDTYLLDVLITDVDWEEAEDNEEDVTLSLVMEGDNDDDITVLEIPIAKATLTSNPKTVLMNAATNITLTYKDADGDPIKYKEIYLSDELIAETDKKGKAVFATASASSVSLSFKAETDVDDEYVTLKVKSVLDMTPPTATVKLNDAGTMAVVTIKDNVKIYKSLVNGQLVESFFPMSQVSHIVTDLVPGLNKIHVLSVDVNDNYLDIILAVMVNAKPEPKVTMRIGEPTEYGPPELTNGTTMVPVRLAEKLGAKVYWNNELQTVTYTLNDTVIMMMIGSKTALVNGENTQLPLAPYKNEYNRTMVPIRMVAQALGFEVVWTSENEPIVIK